jgi:hypothetical protein
MSKIRKIFRENLIFKRSSLSYKKCSLLESFIFIQREQGIGWNPENLF